MAGLAQALKTITLLANSAEWTDATFGRDWAREGADPGQSWANDYKVVTKLNEASAARVAQSDANHLLYLVRANQLFVAGHPKDSLYQGLLNIDVPVMLIHTDEDLVFPGNAVRETGTIIKSDGTPVEFVELEGTRGHMDGVFGIAQAGEQIRAFLAK